jgi:hypothetical protein
MEIDYTLKIKKERSEFKPRPEFINPLTNSIERIIEINADNGYGKTFILNLIAYALFADKLNEEAILPSLKERVADYENIDAYDLEYNLKFNLPNGKKIILSKKGASDRIVHFENEPPMGVNHLHKMISILYDVPVDPNLRLNDVIKDLGIWNNRIREKFIKYNNFLNEIQNQFSDVRDEIKISKLKIQKAELETILKDKNKQLLIAKISHGDLSNIIELEKLISEFHQIEKLNVELKRAEKELKKYPKPKKVDKKDESLLKNLQIQVNNLKKMFSEKVLGLIIEITKAKELVDFIENHTSLYDIFINVKAETIDTILQDTKTEFFNEKVEFLCRGIIDFISNQENEKKYLIHNFLKQLLEQIDELIENDADSILKVLTKNDTNILKEEIKIRIDEHKIQDYTKLKITAKGLPNDISQIFLQIKKIISKIEIESKKTGIDSDGEKYYLIRSQIEEIKSKIDKGTRLISIRVHNLSENLDLSNTLLNSKENAESTRDALKKKLVLNINSVNLNDEINRIDKAINLLDNEIENLKKSLSLIDASLTIEEKKSISKFNSEQQKRISKFKLAIQIFIKNFGEYSHLIQNINDGNLEQFKHEEDIQFINVAGKIIAYTLDNKLLLSDGHYKKLEYYDIINKEFHCDENVIIRKNNISTGLASANYLRQRIDNLEGEFVVILLDEIGNMSTNTLQEVINSIKKIESQKRLIVSILTQPSKENGIIQINKY